MDNKPLSSVIVPVYNVEPYIRKCLNSLKRQTMKQIEVICIDDGSTDNSGAIAEMYSSFEWPIFRCIHTQNHGLSAARNVGIDAAQSDWLMFVDSDDWVEPEFCEKPYNTAMEFDADLVVFDRRPVTDKRIKDNRSKRKQDDKYKKTIKKLSSNTWMKGVVSQETAMKSGGNIAWNKLYHRSLFNTVRYPEGRVFEDIATTYKLVFQAHRIAMIPDVLIDHVYRENSISNTISEKNVKDGFLSMLELYEFMQKKNCQVEENRKILWNTAMRYLMVAAASSKKERDTALIKAERIVGSIGKAPKGWPIKRRLMLLTWKNNKQLFHWICCFLLHRRIVEDTH